MLANPFGMTVRTSDALTEPCEDFSRSRSPSRALRRWRKKGIIGRGVLTRPARKAVVIAGVIYVHPAMYEALRKALPND